MALKKHKLELSIDADYCLLGLVSDEPDYRLAWLLNRALHADFKKEEDLMVYHKKSKLDQEVSLFSWEDEGAMLTYRLIRNRAHAGFFLDDLKNLDYLLHIQGEVNESKVEQFIQGAGGLPEIRLCVPVDLGSIRQQDRLLLW